MTKLKTRYWRTRTPIIAANEKKNLRFVREITERGGERERRKGRERNKAREMARGRKRSRVAAAMVYAYGREKKR